MTFGFFIIGPDAGGPSTLKEYVMEPAVPERQGLYDPANEHDACGVGFVAHVKGQKTHNIVEQGLLILKNIDHRGAVGADPLQVTVPVS